MNGKICNPAQVAYLRRYTLRGGAEEGVEVAELYNGSMRVLLNESRALDVMQVFYRGTNLSFVSKNGFNSLSLPFLRRFEGGMLYTCGLDAIGAREGCEMHGSLHTIPARVCSAVCNENEIRITAEMHDSALFGKHLCLYRTVTLSMREDTLTVEDELVNLGTRTEEYCLLYHVNLGYPMLDEGVRILSDAEVLPRTPYAAERLSDRTVFSAPVDNEEERCYYLSHTEPCVRVINDALGLCFTLRYSGDTLPSFIQWCSGASGDYALGIEPATTLLDERLVPSKIQKGERVRFFVSMNAEHTEG